ncbi:MAG TPA: plastocyanin/azurin family copper-binding protein [Gaiellaceae bacterium]
MRRFLAVFVTSLAVVGTAVAGFSFAAVAGGSAPTAGHATKATVINVTAGEYYFKLDSGNIDSPVPAGPVTFNITNIGDVTHDFQVSNGMQDFTTPTLSKGDTVSLTVNFPNGGQFNFLCTIGEHAIYGMQGFVYVTGGTTTTTTRATTTTTTPPPTFNTNASESEFKIGLSGDVKVVKKYKTVKHRVRVKVKGKYKWVVKTKKVLVSTTQTIPAGDIKFTVTNDGKIAHNFVIAGHQTLVLAAGKSETLDVVLTPGSYPYECSITGHAAAGMKGVLVVT